MYFPITKLITYNIFQLCIQCFFVEVAVQLEIQIGSKLDRININDTIAE